MYELDLFISTVPLSGLKHIARRLLVPNEHGQDTDYALEEGASVIGSFRSTHSVRNETVLRMRNFANNDLC
ncbi:MAG: hypothetical protein C4K47_05045 [Candidatus Thorarchaeota archaeon]|nr:MAG: hypothetical protein C4K47_05045 [Candidatus Thorarchaeota archaeon]